MAVFANAISAGESKASKVIKMDMVNPIPDTPQYFNR